MLRHHCIRILGVAASVLAVHGSVMAQSTTQFVGQNGGDNFGWSAAVVGDVNCDGRLDILIGAPSYDTPADYAGRVYLFNGPFSGASVSVSQSHARFIAQTFGDNLGVAVASAGDPNHDGCADILMGARGFDQPGIQSGRVYLFNGPVSGNKNVTSADAIFTGAAFDELGWALRGGFDLNGDQTDDIAIGAPFASNVGKAYLFFGPHAGTRAAANADMTIVGVLPFEDVGTSLAIADFNHDGHDDIAVGGPSSNINMSFPGRTYIFFGPVSGTLPASAADVILEGEALLDHFGKSLSAGDVNGDGMDDLVVGADQFDSTASGKAYVFHGPLAAGFFDASIANATLVAENFGDFKCSAFGHSVASGGDVNGDGIDDVVVGDLYGSVNSSGQINSGLTFVFYGPLAGNVRASQADRVIAGPPLSLLGQSVNVAGDLDGNGADDLILGGPGDSFSSSDPGRSRIVFSPTPTCSCPGDMNGDGVRDGRDIAGFVNCLLDGDGCLCADVNGQGGVTAADAGALASSLLNGPGCP